MPSELGPTRVAVVSPALEHAAAVLCARWKATLVLVLAGGARRRGALDRCLPEGVSTKVLTDQLRGLMADGVVERVDHRAIRHAGPRHVTYALTPAGEELAGVVHLLARWGRHYAAREPEVHARRMLHGDAPIARRLVAAADEPRAPAGQHPAPSRREVGSAHGVHTRTVGS